VLLTDSRSEEMPWLVAIAERAFDRYLAHIEDEQERLRNEAEAAARVR
jgi:hypothetical protein